ncbi:MAG: hypothetical protein H6605_05430 [Flavobacteriales bacterium]|nr:hypothetical protein [Flavobacteriales bacterium]
MKKDILFSETQKFRQIWLWLILLGINGLFIFGIYKQAVLEETFGNDPIKTAGLVVSSAITIALSVLFMNFRLDTNIREDGIYVRFFPFHFKFKHYPWDVLSKSFVRTYSPIKEYGGWGLRFGLMGKGNAYNVSGNQGLQLEFKDKRKLLIGTKKPHELTDALNRIEQLRS